MTKVIIIEETLNIGTEEIAEVDPMIIAEMKERLNPRKPFDYSKDDHLKASYENEKQMRTKNKKG